MDTPAIRKARGAFFTPPAVAHYLARWAIRRTGDVVFEPSCGDAAFLLPAADRLRELGASGALEGRLHGLDIHPTSAEMARARLAAANTDARIATGDFFDQPAPSSGFDAVIGNPPYVRYQQFSGEARAKSQQAALAQGVRLTGLASSWAAFTIHAAKFLKPDGRLGLVLPAELLTVNYAAQVRRFLLKRFSSVKLVMFEELVFPDVLEEVVLLLAEGSGGAPHFEVYQARNVNDLDRTDVGAWVGYAPTDGGGDGKWTPALLSTSALEAYQRLIDCRGFSAMLNAWGKTYLGAVTGNNDYFTMSRKLAVEAGIGDDELLEISPPGSKHLRGLIFSRAAWNDLSKDSRRTFLLTPGVQPSVAARRYIEAGEARGVHLTYKCRNRSPWWRVPLVERPDLLFTYMNHDRPRIIENDADVQLLNSLYGIKLLPEVRDLGRELLPLACLNSATLLGAEVVGRAYGGGMLKHEPKEADLLPVPSPATIKAVAGQLRDVRGLVNGALRSADLMKAIGYVDRILLEGHLGLNGAEIEGLRGARDHLFQRRIARSRGDRVGD